MNEVQIKWESRTWKGDQEGFFSSRSVAVPRGHGTCTVAQHRIVEIIWKWRGHLPAQRERACAHVCWQSSALVA